MAKQKKWKSIVGKILPGLGVALGGPLGGSAAAMISRKLLGKDEATDAELEAAITNATPEDWAKIKEAEQEFETRMKELDIDLEKVYAADRADARVLVKLRGYRPQTILSSVFIAGYFGVVYWLFTSEWMFDERQMVLVTAVISVLTAGVLKILDFWFGSSSGSKDKTAALTNAAS